MFKLFQVWSNLGSLFFEPPMYSLQIQLKVQRYSTKCINLQLYYITTSYIVLLSEDVLQSPAKKCRQIKCPAQQCYCILYRLVCSNNRWNFNSLLTDIKTHSTCTVRTMHSRNRNLNNFHISLQPTLQSSKASFFFLLCSSTW